ncbi:VCBS repeat-containing protein [Actinosynnema sp. NPDC050436]|uniref:FG-GAP repeat domain-containing protein n=1 Tax=Actinosynnema sp. NPDC050436 TaxID=3155659 RepID=UPI0034017B19
MNNSTTLGRIASAAAVAAVLAGIATGTASAAPPEDPTEIWPAQVSANFTALPCVAGGPSAADGAAATALNPLLNNKMRGYMTAYNTSCARAVVQSVKARGLNERAAAIAIATTIVETSNANLDGGDLDSVGLFQQRASWGSFAERTDPVIATGKFLDVMQNFYPGGSWNTAPIGDVAADVQRPAAQYRYRYGVEASDAVTIVQHLWNSPGQGRADLVRIEADGSLTGWWNSNAFAGQWNAPAGIGGVGSTDHTRLHFPDLDGDGRDDLVRVEGDGTLTAWRNNNAFAGQWSAPATIGGVGSTDHTRLRFGDLDGDGRDDLVRFEADGTLAAWRNNNALAGQWGAPGTIGGVGSTDHTRLRLADLDGDARADLVRVESDGLLTAWWNSNAFAGQWNSPVTIGGVGTTDHTRIEFADLDGDNKADAIRAEANGTLTAWWNNNAFAGQWNSPTNIGGVGTTDHTRLRYPDLD